MGREIRCKVEVDGREVVGRALLETDEIVLRGGTRLVIPFRSITSVEVDGKALRLSHSSGTALFFLGAEARKWAELIRNPKSVLDKLGVKPGHEVAIVRSLPTQFVADLRRRARKVVNRPTRETDVVFYAVNERRALGRLRALANRMRPDGALWTVRPKGKAEITEADVLAAGRAAGLVDVKVVRFSETHTAEKLVIPVSKRGATSSRRRSA